MNGKESGGLKGIKKKNRVGTVYYENESGEIVSKLCSGCKEITIIEGFRKHRTGFAGRASRCRKCEAVQAETYRVANKEKIREINKRYYISNRDLIREKQRKYHSENPHIARERGQRWRKANPGKGREQARKWRIANRERSQMTTHRRLARKKNLPNVISPEDTAEILNTFKGCALTGESDFHFDHVIPLATGHGGTTKGNMIPLRSDLNVSKSNNNIFEWFEANRQRFELSREKFNQLIEYLAAANAVSVEDYKDYVYWCHENPHSLEDLQEDDEGEAK